MRNTLRVLFCLIASGTAAHAATKPAELSSIHATAPYGHAQYRAMFMAIYDADLWTDAKTWSWEKPFALTLTYHMGFGSDDLIDKSLEEMRKSAEPPLSPIAEANYRKILKSVLPDVADGDTITALYTPHQSIQFFHNGKATGSSKDMSFAKAFMGIWLGKGGSNPAFTAKLTTPKG